jgi:hypothetical protein
MYALPLDGVVIPKDIYFKDFVLCGVQDRVRDEHLSLSYMDVIKGG